MTLGWNPTVENWQDPSQKWGTEKTLGRAWAFQGLPLGREHRGYPTQFLVPGSNMSQTHPAVGS